MPFDIFKTISKLCEYPSASGFEHSASRRISELMSRYLDSVACDSFGNVIGIRKSGVKGAKTLLLDAHIDEIGLIITGSEDGFLRFDTLGGVDPRILPAREVLVLSDPPVPGVITSVPPHLLSKASADKAFSKDELYIDIGAESEDEKIPVGTPVVFSSECVRLQGKYIAGRALDDRAGLVSLLYAIDLLKGKRLAVDIVVLASVQEEVGCRGARVAGFEINPDYAIAVDVTHATTPTADKTHTFDAGSGAAVGIGPNMSRKLSDMLLSIAKEKKIRHTIEVCADGDSGTNAWSLQTARDGIATALLSIPLKYMHTPHEVINMRDVEAVSKLIAEFALRIGGAHA